MVGPDLRRARSPLRPRRRRRARAGKQEPLLGRGRRCDGLAGPRLAVPAERHRHPRAGQAAADGLRLLPHERLPRRRGQPQARCGRDARLRAPDDRGRAGGRPCAVAGLHPLPRRPGVRRRDQHGDGGVHRVPARHRGAALGRAEGLRGVRPPVQAGVERPREPVAALHAAQPDDLRRPRRPRRLEHLLLLEAEDGVHLVVARADRLGTGVVLGLPAPGEPHARGARQGRAVAGSGGYVGGGRGPTPTRGPARSTSARRSMPSRSGSTSSPRRTAGASPATTTTSASSSSTPARPGCSSRTAAPCWTPTSWPGSTSRCAAGSATCSWAPPCPSCSPRACTTSRPGARRWHKAAGATGPRASASGCDRPWTSSTGRRSSTASPRSPRWRCPWRTASAARRRTRSPSCPGTCTTPTSRRSATSTRTPTTPTGAARAAASSRRSARRSATRYPG